MKKSQRPLMITIICILGFIGSGAGILSPLLNYLPKEIVVTFGFTFPTWYLFFSSILSILILFSYLLVWRMKKKGVYAYIGLAIINYSVGYSLGLITLKSFIFPVVFIGAFIYYLKEMK